MLYLWWSIFKMAAIKDVEKQNIGISICQLPIITDIHNLLLNAYFWTLQKGKITSKLFTYQKLKIQDGHQFWSNFLLDTK